jgi:ribosome maturation factor RimP
LRACYPGFTTFHPAWRNGRVAPIFYEGARTTDIHTREKTLAREITPTVEQSVPGIEVLALELLSPKRFCVYIDHPQGVDHALCERVTHVLDGYRNEYAIDVSSPGLERPLRTPAHFASVVGRPVTVRTAHAIDGRNRFRGTVVDAPPTFLRITADGGDAVDIPYTEIVRANLIDEVEG